MILVACPNPSIDTYAWIDRLETGKVNRITRQKEYPGGKGVHVALGIRELQGEAGLLGNWAGRTGEWIKEACRKAGVKSTGPVLAGENRKCYTFRSEDTVLDNTELLEPGPVLDKTPFQTFLTTFEESLATSVLACLSGSWPSNAPEDAYLQLIEIAGHHNIPVLLDCSGKRLRKALSRPVFGLHINEQEAQALCGTSDFQAIVNYLKGTVQLIALTKGKEGLWLSYKGETLAANVTVDRVISTVGSGDCLTAGIAYAVSENMDTGMIARYGVACGAANCLREDLGMFFKKDVEQLLPKVEVKAYVYE